MSAVPSHDDSLAQALANAAQSEAAAEAQASEASLASAL